MQSSNRVIKNEDVSYSDNVVPISNIKIKMPVVEEEIEETIDCVDEGSEVSSGATITQLRDELMVEMEIERQAVLNKAVEAAQEEIAMLQQEAMNKGYEEGYIKGHKEGIDQGIEKGYSESEADRKRIKENALKLIDQAEEEVEEYFEESRKEIVSLAAAMAESIVHKTIDSSDENLLSIIKPIVEQYEGKENILLTCHPDSTSFLKENIEKLEVLCPETRFIILEDANLEKNGCTIENESQIIDLQIGKQINSIIEDLKNMED